MEQSKTQLQTKTPLNPVWMQDPIPLKEAMQFSLQFSSTHPLLSIMVLHFPSSSFTFTFSFSTTAAPASPNTIPDNTRKISNEKFAILLDFFYYNYIYIWIELKMVMSHYIYKDRPLNSWCGTGRIPWLDYEIKSHSFRIYWHLLNQIRLLPYLLWSIHSSHTNPIFIF